MSGDLQSEAERRQILNRRGAVFALTDMVLVVAMMGIIKQAGTTIPSMQLVFFRAVFGLVLVAPLVWRFRAEVMNMRRAFGHIGRILCSTLALSCNYAAIAALPLTLVNAIGFTRPFVMLALSAMILGEVIMRRHWIACAICFVGVLMIAQPGSIGWDWGLVAAFGQVIFGSLAVIQTRLMVGEHAVVLMLYYTVGLTVLTAIPAGFVWVAPEPRDIPIFLIIGLFAQIGQFCFLRSQQLAEARYLIPLSYLSIVLTSLVDYLIFDVKPTIFLIAGTALIIATTLINARLGEGRP